MFLSLWGFATALGSGLLEATGMLENGLLSRRRIFRFPKNPCFVISDLKKFIVNSKDLHQAKLENNSEGTRVL